MRNLMLRAPAPAKTPARRPARGSILDLACENSSASRRSWPAVPSEAKGHDLVSDSSIGMGGLADYKVEFSMCYDYPHSVWDNASRWCATAPPGAPSPDVSEVVRCSN